MGVNEMEARISALEKQVARMKDLEDINRLQRSYGYYLEHWMYHEVIDLFSDSPETVLNLMVGIFLGKEGVRRYFGSMREMIMDPEFVHQIMQLSGVVDIDPEGKTAQGRWYGFGSVSLLRGKGVVQLFTTGIYTTDYIKEGGMWKILKLKWNPLYTASPAVGWVKPERVAAAAIPNETEARKPAKPDQPRDVETRYPTGYIVPFHYKHPVSGKKSSEAKRNAVLKPKKI